jgi:hypothetical protein
LRLQLHAAVGQFGFVFFHGQPGVGDFANDIPIAELKNDGVCPYTGTRAQKDLIHASLGACGEPAHVFGNEGSKTSTRQIIGPDCTVIY